MCCFVIKDPLDNPKFTGVLEFIKSKKINSKKEFLELRNKLEELYITEIKTEEKIKEALETKGEEWVSRYIEESTPNRIALDITSINPKISPRVEIDFEADKIDIENYLKLKFRKKIEIKKMEKEESFLFIKIEKEDFEKSKEKLKSLEFLHDFSMTVDGSENRFNEAEKALNEGFVAELYPDNPFIDKIVVNINKATIYTIFRKINEKYNWNENPITLELEIEDLKKFSKCIKEVEFMPKEISSFGFGYEDDWKEWLESDDSKLLEEALELAEKTNTETEINKELKFQNGIIFRNKFFEEECDFSKEELEEFLASEGLLEYVLEKTTSNMTYSYEDYCCNLDSDFWSDYEITENFKKVFGEGDVPDIFVVSGRRVNWRNSSFDNNIIECSPKELLEKITSGINDFSMKMYKIFNEKRLDITLWHHDCPTGAFYEIEDYISFIKKLNISKISIIKAGIEFYGKEYLKNYFVGKDGNVFYDELLIDLCKENEIENKEDFEKIWK